MPPLLIPIVGLVALLILVFLLIASRYKVAKPNEAFLITGRKGKEVRNPETGLVSTDLSGQKAGASSSPSSSACTCWTCPRGGSW